jgi:hypothetical protein
MCSVFNRLHKELTRMKGSIMEYFFNPALFLMVGVLGVIADMFLL